MSHIDVDIIDFLILTIIPVVVLFVIEMICRAIKIVSWIKLTIQGIMMVVFAVGYMTVITPHVLTAICLLALAGALFYQARRSKIDPKKTSY
tara:strand:- start:1082 stop:1357 length:276 start_codon:yes stop_codon:yes gene_type:complete